MKIAFITDNGEQISRHFGRAAYYLVIEVEDGKEVSREMREKTGRRHFAGQGEPPKPPEGHSHPEPGQKPPEGHEHHGHHEHDQNPPEGHGHGAESHGKHVSMAETIKDCEALVCGGMGMGAYNSMVQLGITPVVTEMTDINEALQAYLAGSLTDQTEMLH